MPDNSPFEAITLGNIKVEPKSDTLTLRFVAEDQSVIAVSLPRTILEQALPNISRLIRQEGLRHAPGRGLQASADFQEVVLAKPKQIEVESSVLHDTVILGFDQGTPYEIQYGLEPERAITLGQRLQKEGQQCKSFKPPGSA
ncbi:MAG: hypothetical protein O7I42_01360 [Alphaproteobacteria bacterium]|nr:hypothetical protein [Alphaproteobacteria bacterium]